jgi:hypothetical protein
MSLPGPLRHMFVRFHRHPDLTPLETRRPSSTAAELFAMQDNIGWTTLTDPEGW